MPVPDPARTLEPPVDLTVEPDEQRTGEWLRELIAKARAWKAAQQQGARRENGAA